MSNKLELVLELKNSIATGLSQARTQIDAHTNAMQAKLSSFSTSISKGLNTSASQIPLVGSGLTGLVTPATMAVTAVAAIGTGLIKATDRAAEFNSNFRELANLNLDKPKREIDDLRKLTLETSWKKGFNADETSAAYNEIQSTIGVYGRHAREIVEKQGEFAKVFQADMGDYIAGTAKAMANWRFGNDRLDDFNKSAYAAMQVGVVSFEELSKVQSVYAGAAASVKQDFDTANKLFSLFTVRTKSVDEAATLTKSLFNDLTKKSTVDAFKKIGINMYSSNGQLRQADQIMLDLNNKFMQMGDDKSIIALKNQFRGSEGLIAMIQAATDRSGNLKATFDEFTDSKMDFENARILASEDVVNRQKELANRIDNLVIRLGQVMLPWKEELVGFAETFVERANTYFMSPKERVTAAHDTQREIVYEQYGKALKDAPNMTQEQYNAVVNAIQSDVKKYNSKYDAATNQFANPSFLSNGFFYKTFAGTEAAAERQDKDTNYARHYDQGRAKALNSLLFDFAAARNGVVEPSSEVNAATTASGTSTGGEVNSGLSDALTRVSNAAKAPRNITINIDAFNKGGINTENTELRNMSSNEIEEWFTDMCMRVVTNIELSYN